MTVKELTEFVFENCHQRMRFAKEGSYYSMKHQKKKGLQFFKTKLAGEILDPHNAKERYQPFLRKKSQNWYNNQR